MRTSAAVKVAVVLLACWSHARAQLQDTESAVVASGGHPGASPNVLYVKVFARDCDITCSKIGLKAMRFNHETAVCAVPDPSNPYGLIIGVKREPPSSKDSVCNFCSQSGTTYTAQSFKQGYLCGCQPPSAHERAVWTYLNNANCQKDNYVAVPQVCRARLHDGQGNEGPDTIGYISPTDPFSGCHVYEQCAGVKGYGSLCMSNKFSFFQCPCS